MIIATRYFPVFAGESGSLTRVLRSPIVIIMLMLDRDRQIVLSIGRFGQATSGQLRDMHFSNVKSLTPMQRALTRLVERKYLKRIDRRMVGGNGAGSGQYVYQLGSAGWTFCLKAGQYWPFRSINLHTLAIVDTYVELLRLEQRGRITIAGAFTEPDNWVTIAGADLRPDLHIEVSDSIRRQNTSLWIEIDMGTERQGQIKDKLAKYFHAYQHATSDELSVFPIVLFIAPDDARARELRYIIERGPKDAQQLFLVSTSPQFARLLFI